MQAVFGLYLNGETRLQPHGCHWRLAASVIPIREFVASGTYARSAREALAAVFEFTWLLLRIEHRRHLQSTNNQAASGTRAMGRTMRRGRILQDCLYRKVVVAVSRRARRHPGAPGQGAQATQPKNAKRAG